MHHAGVLTKNWDTVGLDHDNIMFHKRTGEPYAVDQGGSFNFRAQGEPKDYTKDINEIHSYRNKDLNESAEHVFSSIFSSHPNIEKQELTFVKNITKNEVFNILKSSGVKDAEKMAEIFIKRRDLLLDHYK
jgi:hypothetical protein